jgi:hypothetical protein
VYTNLKTTPVSNELIRLTGPCIVTGKDFSVVVSREAAVNYFHLGIKVQNAFPKVPIEQREFLTSGVSPEGWTRTFGGPR